MDAAIITHDNASIVSIESAEQVETVFHNDELYLINSVYVIYFIVFYFQHNVKVEDETDVRAELEVVADSYLLIET